jgi:hypothetical protein
LHFIHWKALLDGPGGLSALLASIITGVTHFINSKEFACSQGFHHA